MPFYDATQADNVLYGVILLSQSYTSPKWPPHAIGFMVGPPVHLGQYAVRRNGAGEISAFMSWAFLSDEVESEIMRSGYRILHASEWNEGCNPWIIHAFFSGPPPAVCRQALRRLADRHGWVSAIVDDGGRARLRATLRRAQDGLRLERTDIFSDGEIGAA
jgi:hemolysin-activating ACP:hemolysin acyltransferase